MSSRPFNSQLLGYDIGYTACYLSRASWEFSPYWKTSFFRFWTYCLFCYLYVFALILGHISVPSRTCYLCESSLFLSVLRAQRRVLRKHTFREWETHRSSARWQIVPRSCFARVVFAHRGKSSFFLGHSFLKARNDVRHHAPVPSMCTLSFPPLFSVLRVGIFFCVVRLVSVPVRATHSLGVTLFDYVCEASSWTGALDFCLQTKYLKTCYLYLALLTSFIDQCSSSFLFSFPSLHVEFPYWLAYVRECWWRLRFAGSLEFGGNLCHSVFDFAPLRS